MIWALDLDDFSNRCHHTLEKNARKIYMVREKYELHKSGEGHHFMKFFHNIYKDGFPYCY